MAERMNPTPEDYSNVNAYGPEASPLTKDSRKQVNMGESFPSERMMPANPLRDETTERISHRGGQASPRTEHY